MTAVALLYVLSLALLPILLYPIKNRGAHKPHRLDPAKSHALQTKQNQNPPILCVYTTQMMTLDQTQYDQQNDSGSHIVPSDNRACGEFAFRVDQFK